MVPFTEMGKIGSQVKLGGESIVCFSYVKLKCLIESQ